MEREKYRIYQAFMCVPTTVVKRLAHQAQKRLQRFQEQADNKDGTGDFDDIDGVDDDPGLNTSTAKGDEVRVCVYMCQGVVWAGTCANGI